MKNKRINKIMLLTLVVGYLLGGCKQGGDASTIVIEQGAAGQADNQPEGQNAAGQEDAVEQTEGQNATGDSDNLATDDHEVAELNTTFFDGSEMELWYGKSNTLIALKGTKLYLYDVKTANVMAETETEQWESVKIYPINAGYCAIGLLRQNGEAVTEFENFSGDLMDSEAPRAGLCVFYDDQMKESSRVPLSDMVEDPMMAVWAVSQNGKQIAYYDFMKGLNLYDLGTSTEKQLIDVAAELSEIQNILTIDALYFEEDGEHLVFSAQTDQNQNTVESWGRIGLDGSGLENHILDQEVGTAAAYADGRLLYGENSLAYPGTMGYVALETQEQKYFTEVETGSNVRGPEYSEKGRFFGVTSVAEKSAKISIYQMSDGKQILQEEINEESEEPFFRPPHLYLFDDLNVYLICYGGHDGIPLKVIQHKM